MRAKTTLCLTFVLAWAFSLAAVHAQTFHIEEFGPTDADGLTYEPDTRDPLNEEDLGGLPPVDWYDVRNGYVGLIEENLVGGDTGYPSADPGALTPEYGVVQPMGADGPYYFPSAFDYDLATLSYSIDNYADPLIAADIGGPDWWWTNAFSDAAFNYITESGITGNSNGDGTWTYSTTSGVPIATIPTSDWYELEVTFQQGTDGTLDGVHNIWDATHTNLLGSVTLTSLAGNPLNQTFGPYYSWFTNFTADVDVLFVDNFKVEGAPAAIPEPSTLVLAGLGCLGLVAIARTRRRR